MHVSMIHDLNCSFTTNTETNKQSTPRTLSKVQSGCWWWVNNNALNQQAVYSLLFPSRPWGLNALPYARWKIPPSTASSLESKKASVSLCMSTTQFSQPWSSIWKVMCWLCYYSEANGKNLVRLEPMVHSFLWRSRYLWNWDGPSVLPVLYDLHVTASRVHRTWSSSACLSCGNWQQCFRLCKAPSNISEFIFPEWVLFSLCPFQKIETILRAFLTWVCLRAAAWGLKSVFELHMESRQENKPYYCTPILWRTHHAYTLINTDQSQWQVITSTNWPVDNPSINASDKQSHTCYRISKRCAEGFVNTTCSPFSFHKVH